MKDFKVGDWVNYMGEDNPMQITDIDKDGNIYCGDIEPRDNSIELWFPKEGEWCWFWNNEKDLTLQKFWKTEQNYFIVAFCEKHKNDGIIFYDVTDKHFKNCEPFIGELPSFLKENR